METTILTAKQRTLTGKGFSKKCRALGFIPAVFYGKGIKNLNLAVKPRDIIGILKSVYGKNSLIELAIEGRDAKYLSMIKDYQLHPVKKTLLHCDFIKIDPEEQVFVKVPVRRKGRSEGEKMGAVLDIVVSEILVKCKPHAIPSEIELNVESLQVGDSIQMSDIVLPEGVEAVYTKDFPVITVKMKKLELEVTPAAAATGGEAPAEGETSKEGKREAEKKEG